MNKNSGRIVVACCVLLAVAGLVTYSILGLGAAAQALPDTGKFKVGSALGEERAGFSGRSKVQVFATANDPSWPTLSACLQSAAVEAEMVFFVGVLVDAAGEPDVEEVSRQRDALQVVVRGLNGAILGGLPVGFTCPDLVGLLKGIRNSSNPEIEKSPIYASLLESPNAVDVLVKNGERAKATRFVGLLKDFEGADSPAVKAAEAVVKQ